jgi:GntR family transcriptional regulator
VSAPARRRGRRLVPLHHQLYVHLRDLIESWAEPATPLPSEPALAGRFAVSRVTVRATLARLEAEGLVRRARGVGTFATPAGRAGPGSIDNMLSVEDSTTAETLGWARLAGPEAEDGGADALGPGPRIRITRLRFHGGRPMSHTTLHVPAALWGDLPLPPEGDEPIIRLLERRGVVATAAEQVLSARAASPEVAALLEVEPGAPLILLKRLMRDRDRAPVLRQESLYAPDRFEYRMTLSRTEVGPRAKWTPIG